jgi:hypothetical protein
MSATAAGAIFFFRRKRKLKFHLINHVVNPHSNIMRSNTPPRHLPPASSSRFLVFAVAAFFLWVMPMRSHAQSIYVTNDGNNTIGGYSLTGPDAGNASETTFASTGLNGPIADAICNGNLYVVNAGGTIEEYALTGPDAGNASATVFASTGLDNPQASMAIAGGNLYVGNGNDTIEEYSLTGPNAGNASAALFATVAGTPAGLAAYGGNLYVASGDSILEYPLAGGASSTFATTGLSSGVSGLTISNGYLYAGTQDNTIEAFSLNGPDAGNAGANLFANFGLQGVEGLAAYDGNLYAANSNYGPPYTIEEYSLADPTSAPGDTQFANADSGLNVPYGLAVSAAAVPEPSTWTMIAAGTASLFFFGRRKTVS